MSSTARRQNEKWTDFLKPLKPRLKVKSHPYCWLECVKNECLSSVFARHLDGQVRSKDHKPRRRETKPDPKPASQWNLNMFSKVLRFDDCGPLKLECKKYDERLENEAKCHYEGVLKNLKCKTVKDIKKKISRESQIRMLVDGLLLILCRHFDIRVQTEDQFRIAELPCGRFDYLLLTPSGIPFCCVETKRPSSFNKKAFVQTVLELLSLQQIAARKSVDSENKRVFAILTDGERFVFIGLKNDTLEPERRKAPKVKVLSLKTKKGFRQIMKRMTSIILEYSKGREDSDSSDEYSHSSEEYSYSSEDDSDSLEM